MQIRLVESKDGEKDETVLSDERAQQEVSNEYGLGRFEVVVVVAINGAVGVSQPAKLSHRPQTPTTRFFPTIHDRDDDLDDDQTEDATASIDLAPVLHVSSAFPSSCLRLTHHRSTLRRPQCENQTTAFQVRTKHVSVSTPRCMTGEVRSALQIVVGF